MKKTIIIFLVLLTLVACTTQTSETPQILKYDSPQFSIDYPSDWKIKTQGPAVGFVSPSEGSTDKFLENVNVIIQPLKEDITLEKYIDSSLASLNKNLDKFSVINNEATMLSGEKAVKLVYTATKKETTAKAMQVISKKGQTFVIVTYTAFPEKYEKHLSTAEEMVKSFRMK